MALANDMTDLLNKIERRLGLIPLTPHLPEYLNKEQWAKVIKEDTLVTFSRFFPNRLKMVINDETVDKRKEGNVMWYYIKDEILMGNKLLGVMDIDWTDTSAQNSSLTNGSIGTYYYPAGMACPEATLNAVLTLQGFADFASLYNRGIYIDFEYPNRFCLKGLGNTNYDLSSFVVVLLIQHRDLGTISPTKFEILERLAMADVANFLYMNLRYYDNMETAYINLDLKLSELQDQASKREQVVEELQNSYVSTSNDYQPYIWTI